MEWWVLMSYMMSILTGNSKIKFMRILHTIKVDTIYYFQIMSSMTVSLEIL